MGMFPFPSGGSGGGNTFEFKMIALAMSMIILTPLMFVLFVPSYSVDHDWEEEMASIEDQYYANTGSHSNTEQNIWTLTGIYTPYSGDKYGYTEDGWIYGGKVEHYSPRQYETSTVTHGQLDVVQAPNGLWYYLSVPENMTGIVPLREDQYTESSGVYTVTNTEGATVYSNVYFDQEHQSNIFFTAASKQEVFGGYTYAYSGYRYVFQPLSDYFTTIGGETAKVNANSTSLSLIWYVYSAGTSGIAGQLAISGSDKGLSYLTSNDIIKAFNSNNYSSTFTMTFNSVQMHLVIRLDPARLAEGRSIADCYNNGYWSVMVYSDAVVNSMASPTYEFSAENILQTLISLFTFRVAEDYNIEGWVGILASMMITAPLYMALLVMVLDHPELWMFVLLLAAIQAITTLGGWFGNWFG